MELSNIVMIWIVMYIVFVLERMIKNEFFIFFEDEEIIYELENIY